MSGHTAISLGERWNSHDGQSSKDCLTVEELSDDHDYSGDLEVLRPGECEEADSDHRQREPESGEFAHHEDCRVHLAERLRSLSCNSNTNMSQDQLSEAPSRKRRSEHHSPGLSDWSGNSPACR